MASKNLAGRRKVIFAFLLLFGPASLLIFISSKGCEHKFKTLDDFGPAINYKFTDSRGKNFSSKDFEGDIVLISTIQERCPDSCAVAFWQLDQAIYQYIRKNNKKIMKRVRIISFATDGQGKPLKDLSILSQFMKDNVEGYNPDIWMIAKGNARDIYDFKSNNKSLLQKGDEYYGGEAFQELILLLDKQNHLRMVLSGKTEGMIRRMKEHIALLQKQYDKASAKKTIQQ